MTTKNQIDRQKIKTLEYFLKWKINQLKLDELETKYKKENEAYHKKKQERTQ